MKHEFLVNENIERRAGDILIVGTKGEHLLLSSREAEAAANFDELVYVGPHTETETEAEFVESSTEETRESLLKLKRDELVEKATGLGIAVNSDTKDELAKAILAKKDEIVLGNGSESDVAADLSAVVENSNGEVTA